MIRHRTGVQKQASTRTVCKCRPFGVQITKWHHSFAVIAREGLYLIKINMCLLELQLDRTEVSLFNSCFFWGKVLLCSLAGALVLHQALLSRTKHNNVVRAACQTRVTGINYQAGWNGSNSTVTPDCHLLQVGFRASCSCVVPHRRLGALINWLAVK